MAQLPKVTFWRVVFVLLMLAGAYATFVRFYYGLGASTNLNDQFPWGIWVGFDVLCGVGLAAGGFTLAATVHIFHIEKYHPIVRPAILTAFLGYVLVCVALLFDLGRPYRVWHPLIMWNPHSVMFEVGWCVTLYTTVLALEFSPMLLERFRLHKALEMVQKIMPVVVILGVVLSTLHQSSLGTLYLIVPTKLHPLWYSPILPLLFYVSAIMVGLAMTIFESWHSAKAFHRHLETPLLMGLGRALAVALLFYVSLRMWDLWRRGVLVYLKQNTIETWLFTLEMCLLVLPMLMLFRERVRRNPGALYASAVFAVFGFMANRLNVSLAGMEAGSGVRYIPKWTEVAVTLSIVAAGFAIFRFAAHHLAVFEEEHDGAPAVNRRPEPAAVLARGD